MLKTAKVFLIIAVLFAALVFLTGSRGVQYAVEQRQHTVSAGQTIWGIATRYMPEQDRTQDVRELVYDIGRANNLQGYAIQPGDVLVIPLAKEVRK